MKGTMRIRKGVWAEQEALHEITEGMQGEAEHSKDAEGCEAMGKRYCTAIPSIFSGQALKTCPKMTLKRKRIKCNLTSIKYNVLL